MHKQAVNYYARLSTPINDKVRAKLEDYLGTLILTWKYKAFWRNSIFGNNIYPINIYFL